MPVLPSGADIVRPPRHVRFVPDSDMRGADKLRANFDKVVIAHSSGSTFAAISGARVIRYFALLHLRTQTPRSGRERLVSFEAPSGLSQVKPCMRICAASID